MQVLEGTEAVPRLLKFRSGHSAPPAVVRHYAEVGAITRGVQPLLLAASFTTDVLLQPTMIVQ
jgi:hypothetical protein